MCVATALMPMQMLKLKLKGRSDSDMFERCEHRVRVPIQQGRLKTTIQPAQPRGHASRGNLLRNGCHVALQDDEPSEPT